MRSQYLVCLVCLMVAGLAYGQAAPPATPPAAGAKVETSSTAAPDKAPEVKVGPDDPVITVKGLCTDKTLQGDTCKTVITRAQFEKLADALQPGMPPSVRQRLANVYAQFLRSAPEAEKRGLDKGPRFEEMMRFSRLQNLSQELNQALQEDSNKISDSDIEDHYKKNEASYEQATLARIYIPRAKQAAPSPVTPKTDARTEATTAAKPGGNASEDTRVTPPPPTEEQKKADEEAMTKVAADLRTRAVKGEDPEALQKEAYIAAGLAGTPPPTKMDNKRRSTLPPNQQVVMELKPGEVSEVITDPSGVHNIYKMISKKTISLDSVKQDIQTTLSRQRYSDSMKSFQGNVDLNDAYFTPAQRPGIVGGVIGGKPPIPTNPVGGVKPPAPKAPDSH